MGKFGEGGPVALCVFCAFQPSSSGEDGAVYVPVSSISAALPETVDIARDLRKEALEELSFGFLACVMGGCVTTLGRRSSPVHSSIAFGLFVG